MLLNFMDKVMTIKVKVSDQSWGSHKKRRQFPSSFLCHQHLQKKAGMWKKLPATFLLSMILSQYFSLYWWGKGKHGIRYEVDALKQTQRSLANQSETILITKDDQHIVQADWDIMKESSSQGATVILPRTVGGNSWKS